MLPLGILHFSERMRLRIKKEKVKHIVCERMINIVSKRRPGRGISLCVCVGWGRGAITILTKVMKEGLAKYVVWKVY